MPLTSGFSFMIIVRNVIDSCVVGLGVVDLEVDASFGGVEDEGLLVQSSLVLVKKRSASGRRATSGGFAGGSFVVSSFN